jgi:hypothetical protein
MVRSGKLLRVAIVAAAVACGASEAKPPPSKSCGPIGKSEACACSTGRTGAQVCREDGTFGECECARAPAGASGASSGGATGGNGAAPSGGVGGNATGGSDGGDAGDGDTGGNTNTAGEGGSEHGGASGSGGMTPGDACGPADVSGCACGDHSGYRLCERGTFGDCICSGGTGGSGGTGDCVPEPEICNQSDDDCNDIADDHFACPDTTVSNTTAFGGGVYFVGAEGASYGETALQQFWPTLRLPYYTGFGGYGKDFVFRRNDDALFYYDATRGIVMNGSGATERDDVLQLTSPCGRSVGSDYGFDGSGTLHYRCADTLRRGDGELVARSVVNLAGVIGDGRTIVTRNDGGTISYAVLSPEGEELSRFPPPDFFTGTMTPLPAATSVEDETAYVALARRYEERDEIVGYMVDSESRWRFVRRVFVPRLTSNQLLLSDGTLLVEDQDGVGVPGTMIRAYLADNSVRIVWRDAEAILVHWGGQLELLVGPYQP